MASQKKILGRLLLQGLSRRSPSRRQERSTSSLKKSRAAKKAPTQPGSLASFLRQARQESAAFQASKARRSHAATPASDPAPQSLKPQLISTLLITKSGFYSPPILSEKIASEASAKPASASPEVLPAEAPTAPERHSRELTRVPAPSREQGNQPRQLLTSEIIRPRDELTQSIEGFLLDQRSEHTRRAYGKDLKRFVQFLLQRKLERGIEKLDRTVLIAYKDSLLSEGLEHTSIDRHLATLRSFFRWLVDDGILEKSPAEGVRFLNPRKLSSTQGFSDEEVKRLLALPNLHTRIGSQHYAILMLLFYCGLRRSELCSLRTSHLTQERGMRILKLRGKGNAERVLALVPAVGRALDHYFLITRRDSSRDQPLFSPIRNNRTGATEKPLDPSMIFYIVTRYAKEAGITHRVSPHSCRATAISNARDHDVPDRVIQEFAGWSSPAMITRYDKRKSAIEKSASHAIRYGTEDRALPKPTDPG